MNRPQKLDLKSNDWEIGSLTLRGFSFFILQFQKYVHLHIKPIICLIAIPT